MSCARWENQQLWKTGGKPAPRARDPLLVKAKAFTGDTLVDALVEAVALLDARLTALEYQVLEIVGVLDEPALTPEQAIERLREVREAMDAPASEARSMDGRCT